MQENEIIEWVEYCIKEVQDKFCDNHHYFIDGMEDDILAYLYHLITRKEYFNNEVGYELEGGDIVKTKVISVQAKTFEKVNSRTGRFDLVILETSRKAECDFLMVAELKWIKSLSSRNLERIKKDIKKINNPGNDVKIGHLLIFDNKYKFTDKFKSEITNYNKNPNLKIRFING